MTTLEEKQKELDALQTAFDEYIASSRELEEELDAELTKRQNDLAKAESRNAALASQTANLQPQLTSLQSKLSSAIARLSCETRKRVAAEIRSEEAESKLRESEGALAAMRSNGLRELEEENEELCERLAFLENEHSDLVNNDRGISIVSDNDDASEQETILGDSAESVFVNEAESSPPSSAQGSANNEQDKYIRTLENGPKRATRHLALEKPKFSKIQIEAEKVTAPKAMANVDSKSADNVTMATAAIYTSNQWQNKEAVLESIINRLQEENTHLLGKLKRLEEDAKPDFWWFGPFAGCIR